MRVLEMLGFGSGKTGEIDKYISETKFKIPISDICGMFGLDEKLVKTFIYNDKLRLLEVTINEETN